MTALLAHWCNRCGAPLLYRAVLCDPCKTRPPLTREQRMRVAALLMDEAAR